ncbi:MAG TPA: TonB-dependent receptor [Acidobacteriaceae bacterium]|nr:TonB-dependent receptor [Acidobacteriaceae bacterium]
MCISRSLQYLAIGLLAFCCTVGLAQTVTGAVSGTVTDPSGAVVPGATVTATDIATGVHTTTKTNNDGAYSIRFLTIGNYNVTVSANGFAPQTMGPFALEVGQVAKFDARLEVAGSTQKVSVSAALAPLLNTENGQIATTLDTHTIENIPLQGRNFQELALYTPGAITTNPGSFTGSNARVRDIIGGSVLSINGNRAQNNNFLLNGIEINETVANLVGYNVAPNALGQVRIISANAPAEYGNVNGGSVIAMLKNGTNHFHGSMYYFGADDMFNANSWGNNRNGIAKGSASNNLFGATLGGPIFRDKFFFFGDYQGDRYHTGGTGVASVATAKMRQGDFSELLDPALMCIPGVACTANRLIQLYDSQNNYAPFVNNQNVPITNPVAQFMYSHPDVYPLPNHAPTPGSPTSGNYHGPDASREYNNQFDVRLDYKASDKDSFFGSYSQSDAGSMGISPLAITFPGKSTYPTKLFALNYVRTFTPSLINEFRAGFFRVVWNQGVPEDTTGVFEMNGDAVIGIAGGNQVPGFAKQNIGGITALGNQGTYSDMVENDFTYGDNLTWQKGRHLFKFGAQFIRYQQNIIYSGLSGAAGSMSYTGDFTSNPLIKNNSSTPKADGYGVADFNMDRVFSMGRGTVAGYAGQRQWRDAVFAQDDWKIRPNLTLNLGVRWEYDQPIYEVKNKQSNVNLQTGELELAGQNGNSRALYKPVWTNFMPRLGFSYNPAQRWVVRGAFGSTTFLAGTGANLRLIINPPWQTAVQYTGGAPTSATNTGEFTNAETAFSAHSPDCDTLTDRKCGVTIRAWNHHLRPSTINEFSLTAEYQLSNTASIQVGYLGETGVHLINASQGNQQAEPCFKGTTLLAYNSAQCFAVNKSPYYQLVGQSGSLPITNSDAMMNYNALQATFRQRLLRGLQFAVNYTYSKSMTNATGFFGSNLDVAGNSSYGADPRHLDWEYGPAPTDATHNVNFHMTYQLPFGRGRMFGNSVNRFADEIIGGWKVSMTGSAFTGIPTTIATGKNNTGVHGGQARAVHYRPLKVHHRSIDQWWGDDPSTQGCTNPGVDDGVCAYGFPALGVIPNARPRSERVPGYQAYNAAAFKSFSITESQRLSFRAEAYNVFNIVSYGNPNQKVNSRDFGRITGVRSSPRRMQLAVKYTF